jgi:hypothetical protein
LTSRTPRVRPLGWPHGGCYNIVVSQRLNDSDVERIASRVVQKLLLYALVVVGGLFLAPAVIFPTMAAIAKLTSGLPFAVAVAITASVIAVPLVALIWLWGRRTRSS